MPARRAPIFPSCLPQLSSTGWQGIGVGKPAFATPASGRRLRLASMCVLQVPVEKEEGQPGCFGYSAR